MEKLNDKMQTITNDNYPIWQMQIEALLDSKDLFDDVIIKDEAIKTENDNSRISAYNESSQLSTLLSTLSST